MSRLVGVYRRIRFGKPVVVVSGLPRSGTSMAMKMLEAGGMSLVTDGVRTADEDNPKGYYEDERVKALSESDNRLWLAEARGKVIKIISFLLRDLPPSLNYKVLFMGRDLKEVLASQQRMLERRGEVSETSDEKMLENYKQHLWRVTYLLTQDPRFDFLQLKYTQVLSHPAEEARRICDFLGYPLDVDRMAGVADQTLYRNRRQDSR